MSTSELEETCEDISTSSVETIEAPGYEQNADEENHLASQNQEEPTDTLGSCIIEVEQLSKEQSSAASSEENGLDKAVNGESENQVELGMSMEIEVIEKGTGEKEKSPESDNSDETETMKPSEDESSSDEEGAPRPVYNNYHYHYYKAIFFKVWRNGYLRVDQRQHWIDYINQCYQNGKLWSNSYMFKCRVDNKTYKFTGSDFYSLAVDNQQLIGNVLDLVIGYHCRNLPVNYVETTATEVLRSTREGMPSPFEIRRILS